ncbi:hypothetical protein AGMMS49938_10210 [Fibrobacterales bacterium]|nr:hypothetical protein AGMMS49938_10210 [Fibrobacterales bacterium]
MKMASQNDYRNDYRNDYNYSDKNCYNYGCNSLLLGRNLILSIAVSLAIFACSDNGGSTDDADNIGKNGLLLNFTSDYTSGELKWMNLDSTTLSAGKLAFDQDSKVVAVGENIFVLERSLGNLNCLLPQTIGDAESVLQVKLETGANPYDLAVIGEKGYIAQNGLDYIQVFNTATCTLGEKIDLPIESSSAVSVKSAGDTLLVVLQRLENWQSTKPGLLVRINASSKSVIDTVQLNLFNPSSAVLNSGKLYVSAQKYDDNFAIDLEYSGIEIVDLSSKKSEVLFKGTDLSGGVSGLALDEKNQILYAIIYSAWGDAPVKPITLSNKNLGAALPNITDASNGLVFDGVGEKLFVADAGGLKIYFSASKTTASANEGENALPPYSLAISRW